MGDEMETGTSLEDLKQQVANYPFDYNSHLLLIAKYKELTDYEGLRKARENMSNNFPLSEKLWIEWIEDEKKQESNDLDSLYEKAVKDYICPDIWFDYMQHSISWLPRKDGLANIRAVMERAITACGLHVSQGQQLWETYREFEKVIASSLQTKAGESSTAEQQEVLNAQNKRIDSLFGRQLSIPLLYMEDAMEEYEDYCHDDVPDSLEQAHDKALEKLDKIVEFENKLNDEETTDKLSIYKAYLEHELSEGDPSRIQCLFERTLADNCLVEEIWLKYLKYMNTSLKGNRLVLEIHARSVRNCPWCSSLWTKYLLSMEVFGCELEEIKSVLSRSLSAGFPSLADKVEVWKLACDQARRRLKKCTDVDAKTIKQEELRVTYREATSNISSLLDKNNPDYSYIRLWLDWSFDEASCMNDLAKAREIIESVIRDDPKFRRNPTVWLEYYQLELQFAADDKITRCRTVLRSGVQRSATDMSACVDVCNALTIFERRYGSLEDILESERRIADKMEQIRRREEKMRSKQQTDDYSRPKKAQKRHTNENHNSSDAKKERKEKVTPVKESKKPLKTVIHEKPKVTPPKVQTEVIKKGLKPENLTKQGEKCTVFVSNLDYNISNIEDKLNEFFTQVGEVVDTRVITDYKGKLRGYAYIQFKEANMAAKALEIDRSNFEGRPIFVSPYVDKAINPTAKVFKYSTHSEQHKIFVKDIPLEFKDSDVSELFAEIGEIKAVRIVTKRNGESKGIAYVEFTNNKTANEAVEKMNGKIINEKPIIVAISNPPPRNQPYSNNKYESSSTAMIREGPRTQLSFMPRSINRAPTKTAKKTEASKPMSNKDFADLMRK